MLLKIFSLFAIELWSWKCYLTFLEALILCMKITIALFISFKTKHLPEMAKNSEMA